MTQAEGQLSSVSGLMQFLRGCLPTGEELPVGKQMSGRCWSLSPWVCWLRQGWNVAIFFLPSGDPYNGDIHLHKGLKKSPSRSSKGDSVFCHFQLWGGGCQQSLAFLGLQLYLSSPCLHLLHYSLLCEGLRFALLSVSDFPLPFSLKDRWVIWATNRSYGLCCNSSILL